MLERLYIHNYKGFVNFELACGPFVFLMGRNGSGKSSVLDVLHALSIVITEGSLEDNFMPDARCRFAEFPRQEFEIHVRRDGKLFQYRLEIELRGIEEQPVLFREELLVDGSPLYLFSDSKVRLYGDDGEEKASFPFDGKKGGLAIVDRTPGDRQLLIFKTWAHHFLLLKLIPSKVNPESRARGEGLDVDGSNFSAWFETEAHADTEKLLHYFKEMGQVLPGFRSINWRPLSKKANLVEVDFQANGTKRSFQLDELSEGELSLLIHYAVLHFGMEWEPTIGFDEPDNYLALAEIEPLLYAIEEAAIKHKAQVFLISHHPEIFDRWARDSARCRYMFKTEDGMFRCRPIDWDNYPHLSPAEVVARGWQDA